MQTNSSIMVISSADTPANIYRRQARYPKSLTWFMDTIGQDGDASLSFIGLFRETVTLTLDEALLLLPLIDGRGQTRIVRVCAAAAANGHLSASDLTAWREWVRTGN